jgi:hypothetical protein
MGNKIYIKLNRFPFFFPNTKFPLWKPFQDSDDKSTLLLLCGSEFWALIQQIKMIITTNTSALREFARYRMTEYERNEYKLNREALE